MKKLALVPSIGLSLISIGTAGCATYNTSARAYGECTGKSTGGGECKIGAEVKWEKPAGGGGKQQRIIDFALNALDASPDAALWQMDTAGSDIPYPASGTVSVMLIRSSDGVVVAAQTFAYVKSGTIVRVADPDAVNTWAYANAGDADTIKYETSAFTSMFQGAKTMSVAAKYADESQASFAATVYGNPRCTTYPSPYQCQQQ